MAHEIYPDAGTVCDAQFRCGFRNIVSGTELLSQESFGRRNVGVVGLAPGRYVIRLAAQIRQPGEHVSYKGTLRVRVVK